MNVAAAQLAQPSVSQEYLLLNYVQRLERRRAFDRSYQELWHFAPAGQERAAHVDKVAQDGDLYLWIARNMAAIRQQLTRTFALQVA